MAITNMVPVEALRAAALVRSKSDVRYYLEGIYLHGNKVDATNGHIAYRAELDKSEAPELEGAQEFKLDLGVVKIKHKIPANTKSKPIAWAKFHMVDDGFIVYYLSHSGEMLDIGLAESIDYDRYPDFEERAFKFGELIAEPVGLNADYMAIASKILKKDRFPLTKVSCFGKESAVLVELLRKREAFGKERMVIMPARVD